MPASVQKRLAWARDRGFRAAPRGFSWERACPRFIAGMPVGVTVFAGKPAPTAVFRSGFLAPQPRSPALTPGEVGYPSYGLHLPSVTPTGLKFPFGQNAKSRSIRKSRPLGGPLVAPNQINAWRTVCDDEPCGSRLFCVPPRGHHGSPDLLSSEQVSDLRRIRSGRG